MPLFWKKRAMRGKNESIYGTPPALVATDALLAQNIVFNPLDADTIKREVVVPWFGPGMPAVVSGGRSKLAFDVEAAGSGAAGTVPAWGKLLRAAAMAETITAGTKVEYKPVTSALESYGGDWSADGIKHAVAGMRFNAKLTFKARSVPLISFDGLGLYQSGADAAVPALTLTGWKNPVPVDKLNTTSFTLHGVVCVMQELTIDLGNVVVYRNLVGAEDVVINDHNITGSVTIEAGLIATKDWAAIVKAGTAGALQLVHGTVAGNKVQVDGAAVQLTSIEYLEQDGVAMVKLGLQFNPSATGNDDIVITSL